MCQIITGPSAQLKRVLLTTVGLIEELHNNNPDGWGALYHTASGVKAVKKLPKSAEDTRKYIHKLPNDNRSVALHWRLRTSGLIDLGNAHPYAVEGGWIIHNGILRIDMPDKDRSDTWHFARRFLDGDIAALVASPKLLGMTGEFIGNNRFFLMDDAGNTAHVNAGQGYLAQGLWFANEYSMSRDRVDPDYVVPYRFGRPKSFKRTAFIAAKWPNTAGWGGGAFWGEDDFMEPSAFDNPQVQVHIPDADEENGATGLQGDIAQTIEDMDPSQFASLLEEYPLDTLRYVIDNYVIDVYAGAEDAPEDRYTKRLMCVRDMLIDGDVVTLVDLLEDDRTGVVADRIGSALMHYCTVIPKSLEFV
jgi:hypothetical protein